MTNSQIFVEQDPEYSKIDSRNRVVIPKSVLEMLKLKQGDNLCFSRITAFKNPASPSHAFLEDQNENIPLNIVRISKGEP